jgi:DNA polymerase-3 subunit alpha
MLHLAKDSAVLVKGQVDIGEDATAKLLVSEIRPLSLSGNGGTPLVEVSLTGPAVTTESLHRLDAILRAHPGPAALRLHLHLPDGQRVTIAPASSVSVTPDDALRQALEAEFGPGCVTVR